MLLTGSRPTPDMAEGIWPAMLKSRTAPPVPATGSKATSYKSPPYFLAQKVLPAPNATPLPAKPEGTLVMAMRIGVKVVPSGVVKRTTLVPFDANRTCVPVVAPRTARVSPQRSPEPLPGIPVKAKAAVLVVSGAFQRQRSNVPPEPAKLHA